MKHFEGKSHQKIDTECFPYFNHQEVDPCLILNSSLDDHWPQEDDQRDPGKLWSIYRTVENMKNNFKGGDKIEMFVRDTKFKLIECKYMFEFYKKIENGQFVNKSNNELPQ